MNRMLITSLVQIVKRLWNMEQDWHMCVSLAWATNAQGNGRSSHAHPYDRRLLQVEVGHRMSGCDRVVELKLLKHCAQAR